MSSLYEQIGDPRQSRFRELHESGVWREVVFDEPRATEVITADEDTATAVDDVLALLRAERVLGRRLLAIGVDYQMALALARDLQKACHIKQFATFSEYVNRTVDCDGAEVRWDIGWCFRDNEIRNDPNRNGKGPVWVYMWSNEVEADQVYADEQVNVVDELATMPDVQFDGADADDEARDADSSWAVEYSN